MKLKKVFFVPVFISILFSSCQKIETDEQVNSRLISFYDSVSNIKDAYDNFYLNTDNPDYIFEVFEPSSTLRKNFDSLFYDSKTPVNIVDNFEPLISQQPDKFLLSIKTGNILKIEKISESESEQKWNVKFKTSHWFYSADTLETVKKCSFPYYNDICIPLEEIHKLDEESLAYYKKTGKGKYGGLDMNTVENHVFTLKKKHGKFKIYNFEFNIESYDPYKYWLDE